MGYARSKKPGTEIIRTRYACKRGPGSVACGKVGVDEGRLNSYVIGMVREFGHLFVVQAEARRRELEDQMAQDEADLATNEQILADLMRDRYKPDSRLTDDLVAELRGPLVARIEELKDALSRPRAELERLPQPSFMRGRQDVIPHGVDGRAYLRKYLESVEVMPAKAKGVRFSGGRVKLHWLGGQVTTDEDLSLIDSAAEDDAAQISWNEMMPRSRLVEGLFTPILPSSGHSSTPAI
jgi:hypothetical protein